MRKIASNKNKYDENIVKALEELSKPLKSFDGHNIYFEENKRYETIFEHISNQKHKFKVSDIKAIPKIVSNKNSLQKDNKKDTYRNYIGERPKKNAKLKYIKIVTLLINSKKEIITTIYLIKNKFVAKKNKN